MIGIKQQHTVNSPNPIPTSHDSIPSIQDFDPANSPQPNFPSLRRSTRIHNPPFYLQDYHHSLTSTSTNHHPSICYPIEQYIYYSRLSNDFRAFVSSISTVFEPHSYAEAAKHDCWLLMSMGVELLTSSLGGKPYGGKACLF